MIDIKKILADNGITGDVVNTIADTIKAEIPKEFVSKIQYSKKVNLIDELNNNIADLEAKAGAGEGSNEFKEKFEALNTEFEQYKANIVTEQTNGQKKSLIIDSLKKEGFNEKIINLLVKDFDLEKIEVEEDKIKGWEETITSFKETYKDFIQVEETQGRIPGNPINNVGGAGQQATSLREALAQQYKQ